MNPIVHDGSVDLSSKRFWAIEEQSHSDVVIVYMYLMYILAIYLCLEFFRYLYVVAVVLMVAVLVIVTLICFLIA